MTDVEAVKSCVKWLEVKIKQEQKLVEVAKAEERGCSLFECGEFYREERIRLEGRVEALIEVKISLEKYSKKIKHEGEENGNTV